jgi:hypothetical protein
MVQRCSLPAESKDEPHAGRRSHSSALVRTHPHALRSLRLTRDYVLTPQRRLEYPVYLPSWIPSPHHSIRLAFAARSFPTPILASSSFGSSWANDTEISATLLHAFNNPTAAHR